MANITVNTLRIMNVVVSDNSTILITFNYNLTTNLVPANASIISQTPNVADAQILQVAVLGSTLTLTCQPMIDFAAYQLQFQNTLLNPFVSVNGDAKISQDGVSNVFLITAPISPDNPVKNYLTSFLHGGIYDQGLANPESTINTYLNALSSNFSRALYDIRQSKNENYLSLTIVDEVKVRGNGASDRLNEESAYQIIRVGRTPTGATVSSSIVEDNFPSFPLTLQRQENTEVMLPNSTDQVGTFNINTLTFNLSHSPLTKVNSIVFTLLTAHPEYVYNIETLGYQIQNSLYDQDFASSFAGLTNNQIRLNGQILSDPLFFLNQILNITIQYESKDLGIIVDPNSVEVFTNKTASREVIPPILNVFSLKHAPITDGNNVIPTLGGVSFLDPNSNTGSPHPAFVNEIPFSLSAPPNLAGQYSVNYPAGIVYVFGANPLTKDGTGAFPPLAAYQYRLTFKSEVDYVYDPDTSNLVSLPLGSLRDNAGTIDFSYQQVFIPNVDYQADTHVESIFEPVKNNLVALNAVRAQHSPITNVFQIYNQSTGEIYTLNRWFDNLIYFNYNLPPRIETQNTERASFENMVNELLFVHNSLINVYSLKIFKIFLNNNTLMAASEDGTGSSFNSPVVFSDGNIFVKEKYFDTEEDEAQNIDRLNIVGQYMIDYLNGVVYVAASSIQDNNIGTISYKINHLVPQFPHLISVNDLYYQVNLVDPKNKHFSYGSFGDDFIVPEGLDPVAELYLNNTPTAPYQISNKMVGVFLDTGFLAGVSQPIKNVRGLFEHQDLLHNVAPLNFASSSSSNNFNITVGSLTGQSFETVAFDGSNYYVIVNLNLTYLSPNIAYNFALTRTSDQATLSVASIVPSNPVKLILSNNHNPQTGQIINVVYTFTINDLSRVIVDYNKGDFYADYTYLADELLISYEWGDNTLDFNASSNQISANDQYYVSYKVGALREALLKNFGTLVNIPDLSTFDLSLDRERYREALQAALSSFIQGATVPAMKNIGKTISHIEPIINESFLQGWFLGSSILNPEPIQTTGSFQLLPAHFGNGVLINQPNQSISLPVNSNLRLEEGTFETWLVPQWNGLDNDALLTVNILKDGYVINSSNIMLGAANTNPVFTNGSFSLTKYQAQGLPNTNKDGVYLYYNQQWFLRIVDGYDFGHSIPASSYQVKIKTNGKFYDVNSLSDPKPPNLTLFSSPNTVNLNIAAGGQIDEGISFYSDVDHYILDVGQDINHNRLSLLKDTNGYLTFRVFDKNGTSYQVSSNVSAWIANQKHHVGISWKLNTKNHRDELHLFIDGLEVPNLARYGQSVSPYSGEKFRTIDPEEIVASLNKDIVGSDDLTTTAGSNQVSSSINFSAFNIQIGNILTVRETGFNDAGYSIIAINGQTLFLNQPMPFSLAASGHFSVNQTNLTVSSQIDVVPNIAISVIPSISSGNDLITTQNSVIVSSVATDFLAAGIQAGFLLTIDNSQLAASYIITQVSQHQLILLTPISVSLTNQSFQIYNPSQEQELKGVRAIQPDYAILPDNVLSLHNGVQAKDLILLRILGLNYRSAQHRYYMWSDHQENVLMTQLPPPISLDQVHIIHQILPPTVINNSNNNQHLTAADGYLYQPSASQSGRFLTATLAGTNINFSSPVSLEIHGNTANGTLSEFLSFSDYGSQNTLNTFISVDYIDINITPINPSRGYGSLTIKETHDLTVSDGYNGHVPVIRYSYPIMQGYHLFNDGYQDGYQILTDNSKLFSSLDINNYLLITSPNSVAGFYQIIGLSTDRHSLFVHASKTSFTLPLSNFTNGIYQVLNVSDYRSGLQNGFFTLEDQLLPKQPYYLGKGFYDFDYLTYLHAPFDNFNYPMYLGSDLHGNNQADAILNQVKSYSIMLTDTRIGETSLANQRTLTKDFASLKPLKADLNTLMLISFNELPFTNQSSIYLSDTSQAQQHFLSSFAPNDNFDASLVITQNPFVIPNAGILDTRKQGTVEFWVSPLIDTGNDPNARFYFDAFGALTEEVISVNDLSLKLSSSANQILSVHLKGGNPNVDYFAGGKIEIDTQHGIQEEGMSIGVSSVLASQPVFQVISVKIIGDATGTDYFANGTVSSDQQTIFLGRALPQPNLPVILTYQAINKNVNQVLNSQVIRLNKKLPYQNSSVIVKYLPTGLQGDRISLFKDEVGYLNFAISASGTDFVVRAPTRWTRGTWHRVKASYAVNGGIGNDQMMLFVDGYQYSDLTFGNDLIFGNSPIVMGAIQIGDGYSVVGNISFKDPINQLVVGAAYDQTKPIFSLFNNLRISNLFRPIYAPFGEPIDVNYNSNQSVAFPVEPDLYTTYLMDFPQEKQLNSQFTTIVNRNTGGFDFSINIIDTFDIIKSGSPLVKQILEELINVLKPANSIATISYTE